LVRLGAGKPELIAPQNYLCGEFASAEDAVKTYLAESAIRTPPSAAVLAVAGAVTDGEIAFTNTDWRISERRFSDALGFSSTTLLNDYAALALASTTLGKTDTAVIGEDLAGRPDHPIAILGAGTGFGAAAMLRQGAEVVLTTEGGHISLAPTDDLEVEIWRILAQRFGRVSIERVLSGPGLLNLYEALGLIHGVATPGATPGEVTKRSGEGDVIAEAATARFCEIFGSVAGDFALAYGAQGGVYLAGGVSRHLEAVLRQGGFRRRFEDKGRFRDYVRAIPTRLILNSHTVAMRGATRALQRRVGS
jgi:glucokinase